MCGSFINIYDTRTGTISEEQAQFILFKTEPKQYNVGNYRDYSDHKIMDSYRGNSEGKLIKTITRKWNKMQHQFTKASSFPTISIFLFGKTSDSDQCNLVVSLQFVHSSQFTSHKKNTPDFCVTKKRHSHSFPIQIKLPTSFCISYTVILFSPHSPFKSDCVGFCMSLKHHFLC